MKKTIILLFLPLLMALASCNPFNEAHYTDVKELAWDKAQVKTVGKDGGDIEVQVYSSSNVYLSKVEDVDWATLSNDVIYGDARITLRISANTGMRRMVRVAMALEGSELRDTITVLQDGKQAYLECNAPYYAIDGIEGGDIKFDVRTNLTQTLLGRKVE